MIRISQPQTHGSELLKRMRKRIATWVTLAIGLLAILSAISAALYFAHQQSIAEESRVASGLSAALLHRADAMGMEARDSYRQLDRAHLSDACSEAGITLMRDIGMKAKYLQAVGFVRDERLECSSFGRYAQSLPLGPPAYVSSYGAKVRPSVDLGQGRDRRFMVFELGNYAAALQASALLDIFTDRSDISLGIYGATSAVPLAVRGTYDPRWPKRLGNETRLVFFDGSHLVAIQRSSQFDFVSYAAVPAAQMTSRLRQLSMVLAPLGLLLGLVLSFAVFLLARQQNSMPTILRVALKRCEFTLHYQPIVALETGRLVGVEALLRWPRPEGDMRTDQFIRAAEDCALIGQFTEYVLARVTEDAPAFVARHPGCYISINLSSADLHGGRIVDSLRHLLAIPGVTAANFMVEMTEHSFLDIDRAGPALEAIRALGIRIAIDDFGTGFSNLSQLARLKVDYLKIDKVFVDTIGTDAATSEVALHIIHMAESLHLTVIGEGIETQAQSRFLLEYGVEFGQGWLFARAQSMAAILQLPPPKPAT